MDHVAIMTKGSGLIEKILNGVKTIESRWYVNKIAPWDKICAGETVYFKYAGGPVCVQTAVAKVEQFSDLNLKKIHNLLRQDNRAKKIGIDLKKWGKEACDYYSKKNYCILIYLINPILVAPFDIDKTGFGISCAWLCTPKIDQIKHGLKFKQ